MQVNPKLMRLSPIWFFCKQILKSIVKSLFDFYTQWKYQFIFIKRKQMRNSFNFLISLTEADLEWWQSFSRRVFWLFWLFCYCSTLETLCLCLVKVPWQSKTFVWNQFCYLLIVLHILVIWLQRNLSNTDKV